jgi:uncharacterized membrane protein
MSSAPQQATRPPSPLRHRRREIQVPKYPGRAARQDEGYPPMSELRPTPRWLRGAMLASTTLLGLYAGILFVNHLGLFPAMRRMRDADMLAFWQALDAVMSSHAKAFVLPTLACKLGVVVALFATGRRGASAVALGVLALMIGDTVHTVMHNLPLNRVMQSWDATRPPPELRAVFAVQMTNFVVRSALIVPAFAIDLWLLSGPLPVRAAAPARATELISASAR